MKTLGIIGAMDVEIELLKNSLQCENIRKIGESTYYSGKINGKPIVIAKCGVGKVRAALCVQAMIDFFDVSAIINTGIAGGISNDLYVGDVVLCTDALQHDFDVTAFGYAKGYMCTGKDSNKPTLFNADDTLQKLLYESAISLLPSSQVKSGIIASGDKFISDSQTRKYLADQFNATAVEMEGAAIAQASFANNIPFMIIRMISDLADGKPNEEYNSFEQNASATLANIVLKSIEVYK